jgi:hypothetical protein
LSRYETKFLNHASFCFESKDEIVLVDPWFFGKVFDNSWSLLRDTDTTKIDIAKVTDIFITHEHPDHLHWATLKYISENCPSQITIHITARENKNVRDNMLKLGFRVSEIIPFSRRKLNEDFYYTQFPSNHDSAYVFEVDGVVHFNQNDCYLNDYECSQIKILFPKIDYWWMQFSLAGYYANRDDLKGLQAAKDFHIQAFKKYHAFFKPSVSIPFASYVYFCKKYNSFLNQWSVSLRELVQENETINFEIPFFGDVIGRCDNEKSISSWESLISKRLLDVDEPIEVKDEDIVDLANRWLEQTHQTLPYKKVSVDFYEDERAFVFDFDKKQAHFTDAKHNIAGTLTKEGLLCFVKFPWGADTLNITSCFDVRDKNMWKFLLQYKDSGYVR